MVELTVQLIILTFFVSLGFNAYCIIRYGFKKDKKTKPTKVD